jgi:hypothetical protein
VSCRILSDPDLPADKQFFFFFFFFFGNIFFLFCPFSSYFFFAPVFTMQHNSPGPTAAIPYALIVVTSDGLGYESSPGVFSNALTAAHVEEIRAYQVP